MPSINIRVAFITIQETKLSNICSKKRYKQDILAGNEHTERLYRQESMLLNLFWQRNKIAVKLKQEGLQSIAARLISTSLTDASLNSLFHYLLQDKVHLNVLEIPLKLRDAKDSVILEVKEETS